MDMRPLFRLVPLWVLAGLTLGHGEGGGGSDDGGCGGGGSDAHHPREEPEHMRASGAVCPPGGGPTARDFGRAFLETHCLSCHSASVTGAARQGAPEGVDFDSPEAVRQWADAIDSHSAVGPASDNMAMPPASHSAPTREEREKLGQWLACGAP